MSLSNDQPIRAVGKTVTFVGAVSVEAYELPDGSIEIGVTHAAISMGRTKDYLLQVVKRGGNQLKALQGKGFTGCQREILVTRERIRGASRAKTFSVDDFLAYVDFEAEKGNPIANALIRARARQGLRDDILSEFGRGKSDPSVARRDFYRSIAQSLSDEEWRRTDLPGYDPESLSPYVRIMLSEGFVPTALLRGWDLDAWAAEYEGN